MKKIKNIIYLGTIILGITAFSSCRKDLSTLDNNPIAGVVLDNEGIVEKSVTQFDNLVIEPKLNLNGAEESKFDFQWRVTILPNDTISRVLSNTKNLNAEISLIPTSGNQFYTLYFVATDKTNGLKYLTNWRLKVTSSIGEGLVVATTVDGVNTDLSHIMSSLVTPGFTGAEKIKFNAYSGANDNKTIKGLVKDMRFTTIYDNTPTGKKLVNSLFAITDNSITRIKTVDFSFYGENGSLFYSPKSTYNFSAVDGKYQADLFIESGQATVVYHGLTDKIGVPLDIKANIPGIFAFNRITGNYGMAFNFYDEITGKFMFIPSIGTLAFLDRTAHLYTNQPTAVFNPANVPNKTNVAAGLGPDEDFVHVLKDKTTGKINMYVFDKGWYNTTPNLDPAPKSTFDLSNAPGINDAKNFVILDNQRVMYYTTANKIYAVLYGSSTPIFEERYTVPAGETITTLQIYQQSDYPFGSAYISGNNNQLVMSTYAGNAGSGKVYIMPMMNLGVGNINVGAIKTYTGFDKVLTTTTLK